MEQTPTDEELRSEYVRAMGLDLGRLCHELGDDLDWLRHKWGEFQQLFEKGQERIDLLNKVASNFFYFLNKLLFEDAMLHLCRLTDPPETMGHTNLTLMRLAESIPDKDFGAQIGKDVEEARKKCEFARKWRDKRLAHTDLTTLRNAHASPLPSVTNKNIEDAMEFMRALVDSVELHYGLRPPLSSSDPWGARSLVHCLEKAIRAREAENQRWRELAEGETSR
jgi:AbiU2